MFVVDDVAQAAIAPIYTAADVMADPQFQASGSIVSLPDDELGQVRMQNVLFRLSETPGSVDRAPPLLGEHGPELLREVLGITSDEAARLVASGAVLGSVAVGMGDRGRG